MQCFQAPPFDELPSAPKFTGADPRCFKGGLNLNVPWPIRGTHHRRDVPSSCALLRVLGALCSPLEENLNFNNLFTASYSKSHIIGNAVQINLQVGKSSMSKHYGPTRMHIDILTNVHRSIVRCNVNIMFYRVAKLFLTDNLG